jgi:DNA-binding HxlR family transcriptional regulator
VYRFSEEGLISAGKALLPILHEMANWGQDQYGQKIAGQENKKGHTVKV